MSRCPTCKYERLWANEPPCDTCFGNDKLPNWTPKEQPIMAFIPDAEAATQSVGYAANPPAVLRDPTGRHPDVPLPQRVLPDVSAIREQYPLFDGLFAYFPAALCEVARWSQVGGAKHTPGQPLHWAREKSTDHENKIIRHLLDARSVNDEGFVEAVGMAWRALALCQTILEERGWAEGQRSVRAG